jgi:hypothetical protein
MDALIAKQLPCQRRFLEMTITHLFSIDKKAMGAGWQD